ncbi:predicted protein [Nematostella vectensis]|uniref:peptidylprolyl isomerase n=1 Tax=Nematostella vectensis TaxID=45351 RepID=A7RUV7_NEMVE|nr:FK506-binding protein 2 [Nematostella vectensis]EDO44761.1 predicted protein [Nematostella vectensis]|eukprot:XP_001636824.1 predicted protein [Nematostella vectensis]
MACPRNIMLLFLYCSLLVLVTSEDEKVPEEDEFQRGLRIGIMKKPKRCPRESKSGDMLSVKYNCTLVDQTPVLPSSMFSFTLGEDQVIAGWEMGLLDMCVGELRELIVPFKYGYGELTVGDQLPPKAPLVFYVELLDIKDGEPKPNTFNEVDSNGDNRLSFDEVARYLRKEGIPDGEGDESHQVIINEIFKEEDEDKDGYISHKEFQGIKHEEL